MDYVSIELSFFAQSRVLALRIHISEITKNILEKDPGFRLELRGQVEMKGKVSRWNPVTILIPEPFKGIQTTYWLKGYRDVEIPDFGPDFR